MNAPAPLVYDRPGFGPIGAVAVRLQARQARVRDHLFRAG
jgi:hypothetical protein